MEIENHIPSLNLNDDDVSKQAEIFKEKGNKELKKHNYNQAVLYYSEAIKLNESQAIYYSNRSAAYFNLEQFEKAYDDANLALKLSSGFMKAHYRKVACLYELDRLKEAKEAIEKSRNYGDYPEIDKVLLKIEKEFKLDSVLPASHPEMHKIRSMEAWLSEGKSNFNVLKMRYYSENYRGVHVTKNIHINETILFIPKKFLITLEMAQTTIISEKILKNNLELLSPKHSLLSTFILREKNNPSSYWKPYLDLLPDHYHSMPIFFSNEDLSWLEGSPFYNQVLDKKADLRKDYEAIKEISPEIEEYGFEEFCWARMSASSRIFGIIINNVKTDAFVPYADMLNHKRPKQTNWSYSDEKQGFVIDANENILKGEPVYDSYGRKCNSRFLLNYGFIVEDNDANEVAVKAHFRDNDNYIKIKESLTDQRLQVKTFRILANLDEAVVKDFFGFVRFIMIDDIKLLNVLKEFKVKQMGDDSEEEQSNSSFRPQGTPPLNISNEESTLICIRNICLKSLKEYKTTYEEDLDLLKKGQMSFNERNCVLLRSGEKEILHFFLKIIEKVLPILKMNFVDAKKVSLEQDYSIYLTYINNAILPLIKRAKA